MCSRGEDTSVQLLRTALRVLHSCHRFITHKSAAVGVWGLNNSAPRHFCSFKQAKRELHTALGWREVQRYRPPFPEQEMLITPHLDRNWWHEWQSRVNREIASLHFPFSSAGTEARLHIELTPCLLEPVPDGYILSDNEITKGYV